jgi:hypothetical protein
VTIALEHYANAIAYAEASPKGCVDVRVGPHPVVVARGVSGLTQCFVGLRDDPMWRALGLILGGVATDGRGDTWPTRARPSAASTTR